MSVWLSFVCSLYAITLPHTSAFAGGNWVMVEPELADHEALLFVGEMLSVLTRHHFTPCLHRVVMGQPGRVSIPFFFRPGQNVVLAPISSPVLDRLERAGKLDALTSTVRISVTDFLTNPGNCRASLPWRSQQYYSEHSVPPVQVNSC